MNHKRHTKAMQVNNEGDVIEITTQAFADSRIPLMEKRMNSDIIPFGENNQYPAYLLMLYNKSAKHNAIINGKCTYINGNGFTTENPAAEVWLKKANEKQSWDDLMKLACLDIENFGGCYFQVIPNLLGEYNYYHISYDRIRTNEDNSEFYYKEKWLNNWQQPEATYPSFHDGCKVTSIFYFKEYRCGKAPYALPSWVAACNWIESDIEVSKHTLTNAKSGFSASKFINFYNGEPDEKKKQSIQRRLENAATGAEGKKLLIGFNNDPAKKPTVDDLGESDLTKEDFTMVDNLITNNIFTGHNITHPLLFGIQQEGKLGNASELKTSYEIFKNTYVNAKQRQLESLLHYFASIAGIDAEFNIKPVEPVGLELDPVQFKDMLPKAWILEKLGIDEAKYNVADNIVKGNETLVNLSGRQQQNLMRIVRHYGQGKLTKQQAAIQLEAYGFTAQQICDYLGLEAEQFNDVSDEFIADLFAEYGSDKELFNVVQSDLYKGEDEEELRMSLQFVDGYTNNQQQVLELLKKQPELTEEQVAEALKLDKTIVSDIIKAFVAKGVIDYIVKNGIRIPKITERLPKNILPEFKVMYSYEKRPEVSGPTLLPTSRPFCQKMVGLSKTKLFSRQDIQKISERLGYSVFTRAGGFWNNNGTIEYHCRHGWMKHIVINK